MNTTSSFEVTGMHCGSCARRVDTAVRQLGVSNVSVDLDKHLVKVDHDAARVSADAIAQALGAAGYPVASPSV